MTESWKRPLINTELLEKAHIFAARNWVAKACVEQSSGMLGYVWVSQSSRYFNTLILEYLPHGNLTFVDTHFDHMWI